MDTVIRHLNAARWFSKFNIVRTKSPASFPDDLIQINAGHAQMIGTQLTDRVVWQRSIPGCFSFQARQQAEIGPQGLLLPALEALEVCKRPRHRGDDSINRVRHWHHQHIFRAECLRRQIG